MGRWSVGKLAGLLLVMTLAACGEDAGTVNTAPLTASSTTADPAAAREAYASAVQRLLTEALAAANSTPESPANNYGWATRSSAYRAVASGMGAIVPPPELATEHQFLIAQATALAEDAQRVGRTNLLDRQVAGLVHLDRAREFEDRVRSLAA